MKSGKRSFHRQIILLICLLIPLFIMSDSLSFPMGFNAILYNTGKFAGLCGFTIFTLQYLWTTKFHFFENIIPYDRRVAIHRTMGFLGFMVIIIHPLFILASYNLQNRKMYVSGSILLGFLALVLLLLIVSSTFLGRIWRVQFETWKKIHYITFIVLTIAFVHSLGIGSDLYGSKRLFWTLLWSSHLLVMVGKLIVKIKSWTQQYKIHQVVHEVPGTVTLLMDKPKRKWKAGQFGFLSLKKGHHWEGWHPFSMSSTSDEKRISMTIKALGDFSQSASESKAGDYAKLNPGFGGFTLERHVDTKYTMIAGGVGFTPIYCLIKELIKRDNPPELRLIYTAHHESELLFRKEIEEWFSRRNNWEYSFVITSQPDWKGISGRLTPQKTYEICNNDLKGTFFICGPAQMTRNLEKSLRKSKVPKSKIVQEYFVFLP